MNMKTINTCDSINDIFGENAELTIPMECPEIVSHIRNRLPDADDTCPSAFIQAATMLFLLNSKGKGQWSSWISPNICSRIIVSGATA